MCDYRIPCENNEGYWWERTPVARKQHTCIECNKPIEVGTKHHYFFAPSDGAWRVCNECEADWSLLFSASTSDVCIHYGCIHEAIDCALQESALDHALVQEYDPDQGAGWGAYADPEQAPTGMPVAKLIKKWLGLEWLQDHLIELRLLPADTEKEPIDALGQRALFEGAA